MTLQTRAAVVGGRVVNTASIDSAVADTWNENGTTAGLYGKGAQLVNVTGTAPQPGPGWWQWGTTWLAPSAKTPAVGATARGVVLVASTPVQVDLGEYGVQSCTRHSGYTPTAGDKVTATLTAAGWEVADKVQG